METRELGETGVNVGVVGLGTEYLHKEPRKTVASVMHQDIDRGIGYLDCKVFMSGKDRVRRA
jgi:aryl-alcohol dehydrogenase-like predicted oxidoreductase